MAKLKNTSIDDTGFIRLPVGTTAERPGNPQKGMLRFNSDLEVEEFFDGDLWREVSTKLESKSKDFIEAEGGTDEYYHSENGITYKIHVFESSGTFVVKEKTEVEYLIVAGGGGGGSRRGGGGGGGGVLQGKKIVEPGSYNIVVGQGGLGLVTNSSNVILRDRQNGENSSAFNLTAIGGGCGGQHTLFGPSSGGSGGGGCGTNFTTGADGIEGQGNRGGDGITGEQIGGGGGGAGSQGDVAIPGGIVSGRGGRGGAGISSNITGILEWYAGGGGGGSGDSGSLDTHPISLGGIGGGGRGGNNGTFPIDGINGTGGGGGGHGGSHGVVKSEFGGGSGAQGADGGSGIVIIRYVVPERKIEILSSIIEEGLVLNIDMANQNSYTGQGDQIFDLATNNNATIISPELVTFNTDLGGSLFFNGWNSGEGGSYISIPLESNINFTPLDSFSMCVWFRPFTTDRNPSLEFQQLEFVGTIFGRGATATSVGIGLRTQNITDFEEVIQIGSRPLGQNTDTFFYSEGEVINVVFVYTPFYSNAYINGQKQNFLDTRANSGGNFQNTFYSIGINRAVPGGNGSFSVFNFYNAQIYNRALKYKEIQYNYEFYKQKMNII